ncbi:hypothetical protein H0W26_03790 [Candidatus Dependentiae bacterium]|nr:hypothetical protein [Candidatus Dependentiae bacterium]
MMKKTTLLVSTSLSLFLLSSAYAMETMEITSPSESLQEAALIHTNLLTTIVKQAEKLYGSEDSKAAPIIIKGEITTLEEFIKKEYDSLEGDENHILSNYLCRREKTTHLLKTTRDIQTGQQAKEQLLAVFKLVSTLENSVDEIKHKPTLNDALNNTLEEYENAINNQNLKEQTHLATTLLVCSTMEIKTVLSPYEITLIEPQHEASILHRDLLTALLSQAKKLYGSDDSGASPIIIKDKGSATLEEFIKNEYGCLESDENHILSNYRGRREKTINLLKAHESSLIKGITIKAGQQAKEELIAVFTLVKALQHSSVEKKNKPKIEDEIRALLEQYQEAIQSENKENQIQLADSLSNFYKLEINTLIPDHTITLVDETSAYNNQATLGILTAGLFLEKKEYNKTSILTEQLEESEKELSEQEKIAREEAEKESEEVVTIALEEVQEIEKIVKLTVLAKENAQQETTKLAEKLAEQKVATECAQQETREQEKKVQDERIAKEKAQQEITELAEKLVEQQVAKERVEQETKEQEKQLAEQKAATEKAEQQTEELQQLAQNEKIAKEKAQHEATELAEKLTEEELANKRALEEARKQQEIAVLEVKEQQEKTLLEQIRREKDILEVKEQKEKTVLEQISKEKALLKGQGQETTSTVLGITDPINLDDDSQKECSIQ